MSFHGSHNSSNMSQNNLSSTPTRPSFSRYSLADSWMGSPNSQEKKAYAANLSTTIDSNSPGYSSRLVHYNEEQERSTPKRHNKYDKLGVFPIVHFFKKDLPVLKRRASPNTSDLSNYNTPEHNRLLLERIITPIPGNTFSPPHKSENNTKSVLDALKEISRKRIHANTDEYMVNEDGKRSYIDCESETNAKKRLKQNCLQMGDLLKNSRAKSSTMNELTASQSSTVGYISQKRQKRKRPVLDMTETSIIEPPVTLVKFVDVETQTPPPPPLPVSQPVINIEKLQKTEETSPIPKQTKPRKSIPLIIFDEAPLEKMRKKRLHALLGSSTPITPPDTKPREELQGEESPKVDKPLVSILSGSTKSPHKANKHVTFEIPEIVEPRPDNPTDAVKTPLGTYTATKTSAAVVMPIVSASVIESALSQKLGTSPKTDTPPLNVFNSSIPTPSQFTSAVVKRDDPQSTFQNGTPLATVLSLPTDAIGRPSDNFLKKTPEMANTTMPQAAGFKFDLKEQTFTEPPKSVSFSLMTTTPSFTATVSSNPPSFSATASTNPPSFNATVSTNPPSFNATVSTQPPSFNATASTNPPSFNATVSANPPSFNATVSANPPSFNASVSTNPPVLNQPAAKETFSFNLPASIPQEMTNGNNGGLNKQFGVSSVPLFGISKNQPGDEAAPRQGFPNKVAAPNFMMPATSANNATFTFGTNKNMNSTVTASTPSESANQANAFNNKSSVTTSSVFVSAVPSSSSFSFGGPTNPPPPFPNTTNFVTSSSAMPPPFPSSNNFITSSSATPPSFPNSNNNFATSTSAMPPPFPASNNFVTSNSSMPPPPFPNANTNFGASGSSMSVAFGESGNPPKLSSAETSFFNPSSASFNKKSVFGSGGNVTSFGNDPSKKPLFGQSFGTTTPNFGNVESNTNTFGNVAPSNTNTFGNVAPSTTNTFGNVAPSTTNTFGNAAPSTTNSFGNVAPSNANTFGNVAPSNTNTFGNVAPSNTNTFGNVAPTQGNVFGNATSAEGSSKVNFGSPNFAANQKSSFSNGSNNNVAKNNFNRSFGAPNVSPFTVSTNVTPFSTMKPTFSTVSNTFSAPSSSSQLNPTFGAPLSFSKSDGPTTAEVAPFGSTATTFGSNQFSAAPQAPQGDLFTFGSAGANKPGIFSFGANKPPESSFNFQTQNNSAMTNNKIFGGAGTSSASNPLPNQLSMQPNQLSMQPPQLSMQPNPLPMQPNPLPMQQFNVQPSGVNMFNIGTGGSPTPNRFRTQHKGKRRT